MDEIISWDPQCVANLAQELSKIGNEYRSAIAQIYYSFNCLGINRKWIGKNFNFIANNILNSSKNTFEEWANYLQITIPETIFSIAQAQAENGGGSVYFAIYQNSDEIRTIEDTFESEDGRFIIDIESVKKEINVNFMENCNLAIIKLQNYYSQFEELETLNENIAIKIMYEQLDEILEKNKKILQTFQENAQNAIEISIQKVEFVNFETQKMVDELFSILRS